MKYLIIFLISSVCWANGANDLKTFKTNTCFNFVHINKADHKWEKTTIEKSLPWALLDKDDMAVYVAQPSPFCEENKVAPCKFYWFRTVEYKDDWMTLEGSPTAIPCSKSMLKILRGPK